MSFSADTSSYFPRPQAVYKDVVGQLLSAGGGVEHKMEGCGPLSLCQHSFGCANPQPRYYYIKLYIKLRLNEKVSKLTLTVFLQRTQQCFTIVKTEQEMIKFFILYTLEC